jgi:hypothetical protein
VHFRTVHNLLFPDNHIHQTGSAPNGYPVADECGHDNHAGRIRPFSRNLFNSWLLLINARIAQISESVFKLFTTAQTPVLAIGMMAFGFVEGSNVKDSKRGVETLCE